MRIAAATVLFTCAGWAQFRSTVPLVVAPTTVTDSKGRYVDGLTPADLILYDNNVPQAIRMDWMTYPIDLVVAVETNSNSGAVLDKLGGSGILFTQLLAADAGETAVISFSDEVKLHQDFTGSPDLVIHAFAHVAQGGRRRAHAGCLAGRGEEPAGASSQDARRVLAVKGVRRILPSRQNASDPFYCLDSSSAQRA